MTNTNRSHWPYGPNVDLESRERLLEWEEQEGVTWHEDTPEGYLHWLVGDRHTRLYNESVELAPARRGAADFEMADTDWLDHVSFWKQHNGTPAAIVAQPYSIRESARRDLLDLNAVPGLQIEIDDNGSWYGKGTIWIALWHDGPVDIPSSDDVRPICSSCGADKASWWFIHRPTATWRCAKCFDNEAGPQSLEGDGPRPTWIQGNRRRLIERMRWLQFLAPANM